MTDERRHREEPAQLVQAKLRALYETMPPDERDILDFIVRQAAERVAEQMDIAGFWTSNPSLPGSERIVGPNSATAGTQDAMKRVLFGAAGVTGGLETPGVINWLVASARDANIFS